MVFLDPTFDTFDSSQGERPLPCKRHSFLMQKRCSFFQIDSSSAQLTSLTSGPISLPWVITLQWLRHSVSSSNMLSHLGKPFFTHATPFAWKHCSQIFVWLARGLSLVVTSPEEPCSIIHFKIPACFPGYFPSHFSGFFFLHCICHHLKWCFSFNIFMCLLFVSLHILKWKLL